MAVVKTVTVALDGTDADTAKIQEAVAEALGSPEDAPAMQVRERRRETLLCVLSQERHIEVGQELAEAVREKRRLEDERKRAAAHWKSLIDKKDGEIENLGRVVAEGEEEREVEVEDHYDFVLGIVKSVRLDTYSVVKSRAMTDHDRQQLLPVAERLAEDDAEATLDAAVEAVKASNPGGEIEMTTMDGEVQRIDDAW